ncbi:unnamed protein product [Cyclocybe aegerita]|uniref:DUF6534 domain-containing protein n=1 Tax=Cyclocybe aegerita TaxID=1973307 RepID=A0A8S0W3I4_CYCAE|nr:unnamed protein product [Cyclocybe aegerita]
MAAASIDFDNFPLQADQNLGAIEIGAFIGLTLFGVLLAQIHTYFRRNKTDKKVWKMLVIFVLFLESVHTFTMAYSIYYDTVTTYKFPKANSYPLSITGFIENFISGTVQLFFSWRIYVFSRHSLVITLPSIALAVSRFIMGFAMSVFAILDVRDGEAKGRFVVPYGWLVATGFTLGAAADVTIAALMIYYLRQLASSNNSKNWAIDKVGHDLSREAESLLCSVAAVATIISFQSIGNLVWLSLYVVLAKLYSNSFLASLNSRRDHRETLNKTHSPREDVEFAAGPDTAASVTAAAPVSQPSSRPPVAYAGVGDFTVAGDMLRHYFHCIVVPFAANDEARD